MPIENQTHVELGSSICAAFNSNLQLNSYRLTQNNAEFKTFVASATEGACSQIGVHCKSSICVYRIIKIAGWKGNKMMRGGDTIVELKWMSSQIRKKKKKE